MKPDRVRVLALCIAFTCTASAGSLRTAAQDEATARAFVASLYRHYTKNGSGVPSSGAKARLYYHSSLLALIRTDEKAAGGEVGVLDGDPVCGCQDWEGIWNLQIAIQVKDANRAEAEVTFSLSPPVPAAPDDARKLLITLVPEQGQWRIWDIRDDSDPKHPFDVRDALTQEVQSQTKHPQHP